MNITCVSISPVSHPYHVSYVNMQVAHDIDVSSNACNRLQEQLDKIKEAADEEQVSELI